MTDELLPCPFCSEMPVIYETRYRIACSNNTSCGVHPYVTSNDLQICKDKWNERGSTKEETKNDGTTP